LKKKSFKLVALVLLGAICLASDHIDSPSTKGNSADLADLYAFKSPENPQSTVFVATLQSNLPPGSNDTSFDENVLIEINIDNNNDLEEDLVIQAIPKDGFMYFFGPYIPVEKGVISTVSTENAKFIGKVEISSDDNVITKSKEGFSYFAGRRQDPFYIDLNQYFAVFSGKSKEPKGGFKGPDRKFTFPPLNILSIAVEVPNKYLGKTFNHPVASLNSKVFNCWLSAKRKQ